MKILVINTGSSSIKYQLFDMEGKRAIVNGLAEKIGEDIGELTHKVIQADGQTQKHEFHDKIADHGKGLEKIVDLLTIGEQAVIKDKTEISAVGHRVVHGGEAFQTPTIIDSKVIDAIKENIPLAPLHNPPNLMGIEVAMSIFPDAPQIAVFDTAFHQTIPAHAFLYALPYELYTKDRVRRYGFHGTSHAFVANRCAEYLKKPISELNVITIHLGNGASVTAVKNGQSVDTSMGMTPLEGLVMGTRSGDVDPALPFYLTSHLEMSINDIDSLMNKKCGMKGLCGSNDMREVLEKIESGDQQAKTALDVYCYRIKKYIGAYYAVLGRLDAVVFTAGIGENSPDIRELAIAGLDHMGLSIDKQQNRKRIDGINEINTNDSKVKILVVPTNEELKIARETERIIKA